MAEEKQEEKKEEKKRVRKGKRKRKNKPGSQRWKKYKIEQGKIVRERSCPRCGPGIFLARMKDRTYCGKCGYTEFVEK